MNYEQMFPVQFHRVDEPLEGPQWSYAWQPPEFYDTEGDQYELSKAIADRAIRVLRDRSASSAYNAIRDTRKRFVYLAWRMWNGNQYTLPLMAREQRWFDVFARDVLRNDDDREEFRTALQIFEDEVDRFDMRPLMTAIWDGGALPEMMVDQSEYEKQEDETWTITTIQVDRCNSVLYWLAKAVAHREAFRFAVNAVTWKGN